MENNNEVFDKEIQNDDINLKEEAKKNRFKNSGILFAMCILFALTIGFAIGNINTNKLTTYEDNSSTNNMYSNIIKTATVSDSGELSIADIAKFTLDSIVEITTETVVRGSVMGQFVYEGAGSGVIISSDGYIVTNNHVISNASKIMVKLKNEEVYEATVIGRSADFDIAILKIEANNLSPVVVGDSDKLVVGETAVVVGNPLGSGATVTDGIISALDREIDFGNSVMNLLQTNAAVNPGNSGGGLFNGKGELVGIVVAKSAGENVEGIGFAIPINDVKDTISDIKTYGYIRGRVMLGVNLLTIDNSWDAMIYGLEDTGVYIRSIESGSDADMAGLKAGDKIVKIDGKEILTASDVKDMLTGKKPNDSLEITILRNKKSHKFRVKLSEYKGD